MPSGMRSVEKVTDPNHIARNRARNIVMARSLPDTYSTMTERWDRAPDVESRRSLLVAARYGAQPGNWHPMGPF